MKSAVEILKSTKKFHISLGLERVRKILNLLDNPQEKYKCFHIAGTNGKGSTSKIINDILIENFKNKGIKTGLFTSPHLFSYTERIKIDNKDIPEYTFNALVNSINEFALKNKTELTEFELLTVVAFYYFYLNKVDYVVLEVGLGGLLDATNVIKKPVASVITTIDFDHTERLGKTIEEIALQKAGIIKEGCSVVVSPDNLGYEEIKKITEEKKANLFIVPDVKILNKNNKNVATVKFKDKEESYEFNLLGAHQAKNLSLALGALDASKIKISKKAYKDALKNVKWKFRLEYNKEKKLIIDGAHNPSGIKALRNFLDENFENENKSFIFGCLKNKDYKTMFDILLNKEDKLYFFEFDYPNALKYNDLEENIKKRAVVVKEVDKAAEIINSDKNLKIVCGSLYMLGKLYKFL